MMRQTVIIPAIDLIGGRCVRLTQGDYSRSREYDCDPLEMARKYEDCGISRLHVVDLDGAKAKSPCNLAVLERIASGTSLDIEWGGGIKNAEALSSVLSAGADRVICGSIAVDDRETFAGWISCYGTDKVILGADVRNGKVATHGWLKDSELGIDDLLVYYANCGLTQVICTDISRDGMLQGPDFDYYVALQEAWPQIDVTLSGGVGSVSDLDTARRLGIRNLIVGKALYEGRITLKDLESWLQRG